MTRVAVVQLAPVVGQYAANVAAASTAIAESISAGADIVVLPELSTSGYQFESVDEARSLAIRADDQVFAGWAALVAQRPDSVLVVGFAELGANDCIYNSAAVVTASGVQNVYRKVHLWNTEKRFFTAGESGPLTVDTAHGRLGVLICYDLEFPEWTRLAALAGVDLLAVPTNWPDIHRPAGERMPEVLIGMAAARVNKMAIAIADRSGVERGLVWGEGSTIIGADGWLVSQVGPGTGMAWADLDLTHSREKQLTEYSHVFGDRFPQLYAELSTATPLSATPPLSNTAPLSTTPPTI